MRKSATLRTYVNVMFLLARCEVNWRREPAVIYLDSKIEGARRHIQNTRRMDSAHSGSICR